MRTAGQDYSEAKLKMLFGRGDRGGGPGRSGGGREGPWARAIPRGQAAAGRDGRPGPRPVGGPFVPKRRVARRPRGSGCTGRAGAADESAGSLALTEPDTRPPWAGPVTGSGCTVRVDRELLAGRLGTGDCSWGDLVAGRQATGREGGVSGGRPRQQAAIGRGPTGPKQKCRPGPREKPVKLAADGGCICFGEETRGKQARNRRKWSPVGRGAQPEVAPAQGTAADERCRASRPWRLARDRLRR